MMQDTSTGEMVPLDIKKALEGKFEDAQAYPDEDRFLADETLQAAADQAIPDRASQGAVLRVGEEVLVKGGRFAVHSIGRRMICLRGLPGTLKP